MDFAVFRQLIRHVSLISGFCSSGYDFAIPSSRPHFTVYTLGVALGFVGNYAPCGLSPQTDGLPVILKNDRSYRTGRFLMLVLYGDPKPAFPAAAQNCFLRFDINIFFREQPPEAFYPQGDRHSAEMQAHTPDPAEHPVTPTPDIPPGRRPVQRSFGRAPCPHNENARARGRCR